MIPTTQPVIEAVEKLAKRQGMTKSIKVESRVDIPIVPSHWIAGVDYNLYDPYELEDYNSDSDDDCEADDDDSDDSDDD